MTRTWRFPLYSFIVLTLVGLLSADLFARGRWPFGRGKPGRVQRPRGAVVDGRAVPVGTPGPTLKAAHGYHTR